MNAYVQDFFSERVVIILQANRSQIDIVIFRRGIEFRCGAQYVVSL